MKKPVGTYNSLTDIGRIRLKNEDRAFCLPNRHGEILMGVLDGMGGANKGEVASDLALESICGDFLKKPRTPFLFAARFWLGWALRRANAKVYKTAEGNSAYKGMGTTANIAFIYGGKALVANVGDSRCYILDEKGLKRLSEDQTYVSYLLRTGRIKQEEALVHPDRHVLMNALGIYPSLSVSYYVFPYLGQTILCCTDGLYNSLPEHEIETILRMEERSDRKTALLVKLANDAGGNDNIGVSLWEALDD